MIINTVREFLRLESASGILLVVAAVLAMTVENSPAKPLYDALLDTPLLIQIGTFTLGKPLLLWINDGLMAVFFLLVGLELKRELVRGELSEPSRVVLPVIAAVGGMAVPAAVYLFFNVGDPLAARGWAIPAATDIAFALGVLSLLGSRVPHQLKLFLLTLAIVDDLGAIIIIALFYTSELSLTSLAVAAGVLVGLWVLNRRNVVSITPYLFLGAILWVAVLKSGVHATLAGVLVAFFIPIKVRKKNEESPLEQLEHDLHPTVAFIILPIFAFANTGISLAGLSIGSLLAPVPLGIAAGLFIGKQAGVFGFVWLAVKLGIGRLPEQISWAGLYGMSALCGIGFTMSLFISSLAFEQGSDLSLAVDDRLGILMGSLLSAVVGYLLLHRTLKPRTAQAS